MLAQLILKDVEFVHKPEEGEFSTDGFSDPMEAVKMIVRRHPMRMDQIYATANGLPPAEVDRVIEALEVEGKIQRVTYNENVYFGAGEAHYARRVH